MRYRTVTTLGAIFATALGFAIAVVLFRDLFLEDVWVLVFAGLLVVPASIAGVIIGRRRFSTPYDDISWSEVRAKARRGELEGLSSRQLRTWRRLIIAAWALAITALPAFWYVAGLRNTLVFAAVIACGAVSSLVCYRAIRRSSAGAELR